MRQHKSLSSSNEIEIPNNGDRRSTQKLIGEEYVDFLFKNHAEISQLVEYALTSSRTIQIKPRPEAFGVVTWIDKTFYVYPKFCYVNTKPNFDVLTSLLFMGTTYRPKFMARLRAFQERDGLNDNYFDFFFYLFLSELKEFLKVFDAKETTIIEEDIRGVRGRIKMESTIRRFPGLEHIKVCEQIDVTFNQLILGVFKYYVKTISKISRSHQVSEISRAIGRNLAKVKELEPTYNRLSYLESYKNQIRGENRKVRDTYVHIIHCLNFIFEKSSFFSTSGFVFNMNNLFEKVTGELIANVLPSEMTLESGNIQPETLLNSSTTDLEIDNDWGEFSSACVKIKPDFVITEPSKRCIVLDAKYKLISRSLKGKINGIKSKDVQQMLTYWLHYAEKTKTSPEIVLIYPNPLDNTDNGTVVELGKLFFETSNLQILGQNRIILSIIGIDIKKTLEILSTPQNCKEELLKLRDILLPNTRK